MTVAVVALVRPTSDGKPLAPFIGTVDTTLFYDVLFLMLAVLTIAFSSAYAGQFRAHRLAQSLIDLSVKGRRGHSGAHPRDRFDMLRIPKFNRVAPLAQMILGKAEFYTGAEDCPKWRRVVSTFYYILLKLVSVVVYFGLPAFALFHAWKETSLGSYLWWLGTFAAAFATLTLIQICLDDLFTSATKVVPQLWAGSLENRKGG
jgi:hypothetical protein